MLTIRTDYGWIAYLIQIVIVAIKLNYTAFCIYIGFCFLDIKIKYKKLVKISLYAESIFVLYSGIRLLLIFVKDFDNLEQIQSFYPLSLYSLFSSNSIPTWLFYPLYAINLSQLIYWILLSIGISLLIKTKYLKSFKIVMSSYGLGLLFWILIVVFAQVYFLPSGTT